MVASVHACLVAVRSALHQICFLLEHNHASQALPFEIFGDAAAVKATANNDGIKLFIYGRVSLGHIFRRRPPPAFPAILFWRASWRLWWARLLWDSTWLPGFPLPCTQDEPRGCLERAAARNFQTRFEMGSHADQAAAGCCSRDNRWLCPCTVLPMRC